MATLYIAEFASTIVDHGRGGSAAQQPPIAEQTVAIGGVSAQSNAFNAATKVVRLHTDSICSILFGTNPTATNVNIRMATNQTEYFGVEKAGTALKVAVITNT